MNDQSRPGEAKRWTAQYEGKMVTSESGAWILLDDHAAWVAYATQRDARVAELEARCAALEERIGKL